jgi:hypothetical protein
MAMQEQQSLGANSDIGHPKCGLSFNCLATLVAVASKATKAGIPLLKGLE